MSELNIAIVGHIDHGKSTLLGRLLFDTDNISKSKKEGLSIDGVDNINFAQLLDSFEQEQKENKTINSMRVAIDIENKKYVFFDIPGHVEYIDRMITSISKVDYAFIIIDVLQGIQEQTIHHLNMLKLFNIKNIIVIINKMDSVDYKQSQFQEVKKDICSICDELDINIDKIIPISAQKGINVTKNQDICKWYREGSLTDLLNEIKPNKDRNINNDFVLSVQDIYEIDKSRYIAGKVLSGNMYKDSSEISNIKTNEKGSIISMRNNSGDYIDEVVLGSVTLLQLEYAKTIKRGDIFVKKGDAVKCVQEILVNIVCTSDEKMDESRHYDVNIATQATGGHVVLQKKIYINKNTKNKGNILRARVIFDDALALSKYEEIVELGTITIMDNGAIIAIGIV
jgi:small GTP-binding protein